MKILKKPKNKHGSASVFLAIVMSILILVDGIYLEKIVEIERKMKIMNGLRLQVEQILACFDEQLFDVYGIYAFKEDDINYRVYNNFISTNGWIDADTETETCISQVALLDNDAIRNAIVNYYTLRGSAVVTDDLSFLIDYLFDKYDEYGIRDTISEFTSSDTGKYLEQLIDGTIDISEYISDIEFLENLGGDSEFSGYLSAFIEQLNEMADEGIDNYFDLSMRDFFASDAMNTINDVNYDLNSAGNAVLSPFYISHYASHNFDCVIEEFYNGQDKEYESTFNGTSFKDIHANNTSDVEYILTGKEGTSGVVEAGLLVNTVITLSEFIHYLTDEDFMKIATTFGDIMFEIMSLFDCPIPATVWKYMFVVAVVKGTADGKNINLYRGYEIILFDISELPEPLNEGVPLDYKDIMVLLLNFVPSETKLSRIRDVLYRDYGDLYTGVELFSTYMNSDYRVSEEYSLYRYGV